MSVIFKPDLHETIQWFRLDATHLDLLCSLALFPKLFLMICLLYPQGQTYVWAKNTISILFHISINIFALFCFVLFFLVVMLPLFGGSELPTKAQALCICVSPADQDIWPTSSCCAWVFFRRKQGMACFQGSPCRRGSQQPGHVPGDQDCEGHCAIISLKLLRQSWNRADTLSLPKPQPRLRGSPFSNAFVSTGRKSLHMS